MFTYGANFQDFYAQQQLLWHKPFFSISDVFPRRPYSRLREMVFSLESTRLDDARKPSLR
jgi:hypothetical protein